MTRMRAYLLTGAALGLLSIGAVGCTEPGPAPASAKPAPPTTSAPAAATPPGRGTAAAAAQEKRVKEVLDTVSPDAPEFVESGVERVEDGVHHRSRLTKGSAYQLAVVCVGEGTVVPVVGGEETEAVPCDGVTVTHRIASAPAELPLAVEGRAGASGAVGWRVVAVTG
ncbi:hypothetical protein J3A78_003082 [Streptomyces sp. PvR006]|uniref:hypothetical protein n=1 Tax=unclassified Streptomyces TaxID=2593676 RepID=UPI001AE720F8|nr:hypothetical protein [Streptomyces sp. PvR006]MBP2582604.1 hypothetical protein [Streptomyces sp. PvR006]